MAIAIVLGTNSVTELISVEGSGSSSDAFTLTGSSQIVRDVWYQGAAPVEIESDEAKVHSFLINSATAAGLSYGALLITGDRNHVTDFHVGNQPATVPAVQVGGEGNMVTRLRTEIGKRTQVVVTGDYNKVAVCDLEAGSSANDTYDGVQVDGDYNTINDVTVRTSHTGGTNHPRYGVNVTSGATGNYIGVVLAPTAVSGVLLDNGTGTITI